VNLVLSVVVASIVAFVVSSIWYAALTPVENRLLGGHAPDRGKRPPPQKVLLELIRNLVLATVIAGLARQCELTGVGSTVVLGLVLWVGFPAVLLTGSMMWEKTQAVTAALHGGDWLVKLLAMSVIIGVWL
jgi:hypothetical protein